MVFVVIMVCSLHNNYKVYEADEDAAHRHCARKAEALKTENSKLFTFSPPMDLVTVGLETLC